MIWYFHLFKNVPQFVVIYTVKDFGAVKWIKKKRIFCLKNDRMVSVHFQGKPFAITVVQVYAPTTSAEEAEVEQFCEDLQDLLELTPKKKKRKEKKKMSIAPYGTGRQK